MNTRPIRLLVVDDSAVMRQAMIAIGKSAGDIEVTVAADPLIAQSKVERGTFDVVLLDVEMPRMDGLTYLRKLMSERPMPVIVCSALAGRGTDVAVRALEEGAVDVVEKPRVSLHEFLAESNLRLVDTIRGAAAARLRKRSRAVTPPAALPVPAVRGNSPKIVAIGASTGGTEALREILEAMPAGAPGMVIVQHMPELFTAAFARRLNDTCRIQVKEAAEGDRVIAGRALIAPGNRHVLLRRDGAQLAVQLSDGPLVSRHRPSVDVLFQSVARVAGPAAIGVILTGMGSDGAAGLLEMHHAGAVTIAQDESTSIVFGMPGAAIGRGGVEFVHPLPSIAAAILGHA
ncbi:MAG TPA: chemotaxis response regulator protein-glutamate methylesterase [Thermoanaerobaculia bacterium]